MLGAFPPVDLVQGAMEALFAPRSQANRLGELPVGDSTLVSGNRPDLFVEGLSQRIHRGLTQRRVADRTLHSVRPPVRCPYVSPLCCARNRRRVRDWSAEVPSPFADYSVAIAVAGAWHLARREATPRPAAALDAWLARCYGVITGGIR